MVVKIFLMFQFGLVWFYPTFLHQIFHNNCYGHEDIMKIVRIFGGDVGVNGLNGNHH